MIIEGNRNLSYAVIHVYTDNIDKINELLNFIPVLEDLNNKNFVPVFYKELKDYSFLFKKYAIRNNILSDYSSINLHHFLYDIKDNQKINMDFLLNLMNKFRIYCCYYFNKESTITEKNNFMCIKENIKNNNSIYPSFMYDNQPNKELVYGLQTNRQTISIDNKQYTKYDITYINKVWKNMKNCKCDIHNYILYYDNNGLKTCPNSNTYYTFNDFKNRIKNKFLLCNNKICAPYLLEYGIKEKL